MAKQKPKGNLVRNLVYLIVVFLILGSFLSYASYQPEPEEIGLSELAAKIQAQEVDSVTISGEQNLTITLKDQTEVTSRKEISESLPSLLTNYGLTVEEIRSVNIKVEQESGWSYWGGAILPFLLPFIFIGGFIWLMMRQVAGSSNKAMMFGQSKARETDPKNNKDKIKFSDVAGVKEAKEELSEIVEFLRYPKKFQALGARVPKGVLLLGPPGTGKTLMSRAVAGEADVPFYHISGSEFVEMFVGVGASRVRDLFKKAKKNAPSIVFIDEIDAVGRQRGAGLGGSHDEREQTLNQILVELDGFEPDSGVIVIAATNRPDVLDPALLRPGRFDRRVVLDLPDINDREDILKVHARKKPLAKDVKLRELAERTPGFSGADLFNLLNEAAILAARKDQKIVTQINCLESIEKVMLGPERKSALLSDTEKKITAYHEAGHALVAHILPKADPVRKVSIISRGRAAGYTLKLPKEDKRMHAKSEFESELAVMLAGHATEKEVYGEVTTGATNDLNQATKLARRLVTEYGMSEKMGPRTFGEREEMVFLGRDITEHQDYSEETARAIDVEVSNFIDQAYKKAQQVIAEHKDKLEEIANQLLTKEVLEQDEFEAIFSPKIDLKK